MDISGITEAIVAALGVSGIVLGWASRMRTIRQQQAEEEKMTNCKKAQMQSMRSDMDYIKNGVDDIRLKQVYVGIEVGKFIV
ncbi:hypothetical protein [Paenibacillus cremeus]|uniref:Uncharacterized protein n=1 Tax=Paenibacillus cremeus TaxID=2163881 RepID=A0A559K510_9BACL|nr:hypothetical protein [Paenibacillus cremeus]TVY07229.1 hypothetical protein FPZ49_25330 [Paenibacillus cremeus]